MKNMDQKIDELKSQKQICGNLFKKFRKQTESQLTNELNKQCKRIEELESDKTMFHNQGLEIKKTKLAETTRNRTAQNNTEEDCASGLKEFQQRRMKQ